MPPVSAQFTAGELTNVMSRYDVGAIYQMTPLSGGNRRAPKMVIISAKGKFLLKRRPKTRDDLSRVGLAHAVQTHLTQHRFPVTKLVRDRKGERTLLRTGHHIYELFKFVTGARYDGSVEATVEAGRRLAKLHQHLADFSCEFEPSTGSFHDSASVRRYLKLAGGAKGAQPDKKVKATAEILMTLYNSSSTRVNQLGFDSWPLQIVHGDWHPGNMLFSGHKLAAVLDFDSLRLAPTPTDLANGMLQFSIVAGRPKPADWPAYLDQAKLVRFFSGYHAVIRPTKNQLRSLLDLMIETMIAEAILPIAATGTFGSFGGVDFLKMIQRKAKWIDRNRKTLSQAIGA